MFRAAQSPAAAQRCRAEAAQLVARRDVREVAERVDAGESLHGQVRLHVDSASAPLAARGGRRSARPSALRPTPSDAS